MSLVIGLVFRQSPPPVGVIGSRIAPADVTMEDEGIDDMLAEIHSAITQDFEDMPPPDAMPKLTRSESQFVYHSPSRTSGKSLLTPLDVQAPEAGAAAELSTMVVRPL